MSVIGQCWCYIQLACFIFRLVHSYIVTGSLTYCVAIGENFEDRRDSILFYLSTLNRDLALRVDEPAKPTDKSTAVEKAE